MPKVFLTDRQKQNDVIIKILYKNMGANGMNQRVQLADRLKMNRTTMNNRFNNPEKFTISELRKIIKLLKIPEEEIIKMFLTREIS